MVESSLDFGLQNCEKGLSPLLVESAAALMLGDVLATGFGIQDCLNKGSDNLCNLLLAHMGVRQV